MRDAVRSAMRMLSVEPLTLGVPVHCVTEGMSGLFDSLCAVVLDAKEDEVACNSITPSSQVMATWKVALGV